MDGDRSAILTQCEEGIGHEVLRVARRHVTRQRMKEFQLSALCRDAHRAGVGFHRACAGGLGRAVYRGSEVLSHVRAADHSLRSFNV